MFLILLSAAMAQETCQKDELCVYEDYWDQCLAKSKAFEDTKIAFDLYKSKCTLKLDDLQANLIQYKALFAESQSVITEQSVRIDRLNHQVSQLKQENSEVRKDSLKKMLAGIGAGAVIGGAFAIAVIN